MIVPKGANWTGHNARKYILLVGIFIDQNDNLTDYYSMRLCIWVLPTLALLFKQTRLENELGFHPVCKSLRYERELDRENHPMNRNIKHDQHRASI